MFSRFSLLALVAIGQLYAIDDLSQAKVGECFSKVIMPPQFEVKDEKIEIQKASKKVSVTPAIFEKMKKDVVIQEAYIDLQEIRAEFKEVKIKLPISEQKEFFATDKDGHTPISLHMLVASKLNGLDVKNIKIGECFREYYEKSEAKKEKKEFVTREAYESIDIQKPEFKTVTKKIVVKPAYKKIIKTPAVYETKVIKMLVQSAKKEWIKSDCNKNKSECDSLCLVETPARYKTITKKILLTAPLTKVIEFPVTYKEVEVKEVVKKATSSRKVMPELKLKYDVSSGVVGAKFFWLKDTIDTKGLPTGYAVCRVKSNPEFREFTKEIVSVPASVKKIEVSPKTVTLDIEKLLKEGNVTTISVPPMYEDVKSKVLLSPGKIVWKKVICKSDLSVKVIKNMQSSLKKKGYYRFKVDGRLGRGTKNALTKFQKASKLPSGGYTVESLNALGLSF